MRVIEVPHIVALVESIGLETFLGELGDYIADDFRRWPEFDKSPRYASHSPGGVVELMPTADAQNFGFKYVNGHPKNYEKGLQTVVGFGVLADTTTGYPYLITEMTILTALRTAATSAMAARHLARASSEVMALIGLGAQSEFQATAFKSQLGIRKLRVYDIDSAATAKFLRNMEGKGFEIVVAQSAPEALQGADIVTTVTADKKQATILSDNMIGSGIHINAVGGDCPGKTELQAAILNRSSVFVEHTPQTRIEGEIQQMPDDFAVTELWKVVAGDEAGRTSDDQITLFDSVGFAIEDFSALRYVWDKSNDQRFHSVIDLLAGPEDPRNLFGLLSGTEDVTTQAVYRTAHPIPLAAA
jgi:ornithine cyclodeaminase